MKEFASSGSKYFLLIGALLNTLTQELIQSDQHQVLTIKRKRQTHTTE